MAIETLRPKETILVADDNLHNRLVVEGYLEEAGYGVIQAENGKEAVDIFASSLADLVLLDVVMPVMDGFDACQCIRAMDRGRGVPILFVTALGDLETHDKALNSGADDFLSKPIQRVELLLRVKSLLRIKRLENDLSRSNAFISSQRDALLLAQEEKRRLTAMIVHDLKNPLMSVLGNAEYLLDDGFATESSQEALRDIHTATDTMHRMVMDLLDVARSEDGALTPRFEPVDVPCLLDEIRSYVRGRGRKSRHQIIVNCERTVGPVQADRDLIRRVIENLLDNSLKYAPFGTEVRLEISSADDDRLLCKVHDRGPGVPPEYREKIFEQYMQLDRDQRAHMRTGRGLGLAFSRLAIQAHGGEIWVEANQPAGSVFCFSIPMAQERSTRLGAAKAGHMAGRAIEGAAEWMELSSLGTPRVA